MWKDWKLVDSKEGIIEYIGEKPFDGYVTFITGEPS